MLTNINTTLNGRPNYKISFSSFIYVLLVIGGIFTMIVPFVR